VNKEEEKKLHRSKEFASGTRISAEGSGKERRGSLRRGLRKTVEAKGCRTMGGPGLPGRGGEPGENEDKKKNLGEDTRVARKTLCDRSMTGNQEGKASTCQKKVAERGSESSMPESEGEI